MLCSSADCCLFVLPGSSLAWIETGNLVFPATADTSVLILQFAVIAGQRTLCLNVFGSSGSYFTIIQGFGQTLHFYLRDHPKVSLLLANPPSNQLQNNLPTSGSVFQLVVFLDFQLSLTQTAHNWKMYLL